MALRRVALRARSRRLREHHGGGRERGARGAWAAGSPGPLFGRTIGYAFGAALALGDRRPAARMARAPGRCAAAAEHMRRIAGYAERDAHRSRAPSPRSPGRRDRHRRLSLDRRRRPSSRPPSRPEPRCSPTRGSRSRRASRRGSPFGGDGPDVRLAGSVPCGCLLDLPGGADPADSSSGPGR